MQSEDDGTQKLVILEARLEDTSDYKMWSDQSSW